MADNLVIVESPAKAKTISKFLGKDYEVTSCFGHIRDLSKKEFGIDIEKNYKPNYIVPDDKKKIVNELKNLTKKASTVWLASDEDREGEAIAWHLSEVLGLDIDKTKRIVFHEITKNAILDAIKTPRTINVDLVNAQQARRVLDRIVGFELSPVLWKKVKPSLSAGRVQSVAVRLLVEREREIIAFVADSSVKINANFLALHPKKVELNAELQDKIKTEKEAKEFLELCKNASFKIADVTKKPAKKSPSPPFTTSTLQQEASRKLGFSVARTMTIAQKLYEAGKITYMRTDSVNLSNTVLDAAKAVITSEFGEKYVNIRQYTTKSKGAQEAHEAIRPTFIEHSTIAGTPAEKKLYELIWKRTVASQMKEAELEKTTITIDMSNSNKKFIATGEVIKFDGFLKLYFESTDDENEEENSKLLPPLKVNEELTATEINATERFSHHPPRYTEASLVRKLEELGIGRPSTYAPTISTIQNRGYVVKEDRQGITREYFMLKLKNKTISKEIKTEITGAEKNKLFPSDIGMVVNDFLIENFKEIMDFNFTASVEKEFDEIAEGKIKWTKMIDNFYNPFHTKVDTTLKTSEKSKGKRLLGNDPKSNKPVYVLVGRYGPVVQLGELDDVDKPKFASLLKGQYIETITLEQAIDLFQLPRSLGNYESHEVTVGIGRFGPYVKHNNIFISLKKEDNPLTINIDRAIELIIEKREATLKKIIQQFDEEPELSVLNGRYGPYISYKKENYKIPKNVQPDKLTLKECMEIIQNSTKKKK